MGIEAHFVCPSTIIDLTLFDSTVCFFKQNPPLPILFNPPNAPTNAMPVHKTSKLQPQFNKKYPPLQQLMHLPNIQGQGLQRLDNGAPRM